jgi:hypothetical protein
MSTPQLLKRRYTDHLTKASDHDILIELSTKMTAVCLAHTVTQKDLKDFMKRSEDKCDERIGGVYTKIDDKTSKQSSFKIIGIAVGLFVILFGAMGINRVFTTSNAVLIANNAKHIERNAKAINALAGQHKHSKDLSNLQGSD